MHTQNSRSWSCSCSTPHIMGHGPGRPVKTHGPPHRPGGTAHIEPTSHGPRPGPAHHILSFSRPGPARPIKFSKVSARPGPSQFSDRPGPVRPRQTAHDKRWYCLGIFRYRIREIEFRYLSVFQNIEYRHNNKYRYFLGIFSVSRKIASAVCTVRRTWYRV